MYPPIVVRTTEPQENVLPDRHRRTDHSFRICSNAPEDVGLRQRRVVAAVRAELPLQAVRELEHSALALDLGQRLLAGGVGDVLTEHDDARVAAHLVVQRQVDEVDHGARIPLVRGFRVERVRGGVDVGRVDPALRRLARLRGPAPVQRPVGRVLELRVDLGADLLQLLLGRHLLAHESPRERDQRVAGLLLLDLVGGPIEALIVRHRVRVRTDHLRVDQGGPLALAAVFERRTHRVEGGDRVAPVAPEDLQRREALHGLADRGARGLHLARHGDRVFVVLDEEHDGQPEHAGGGERLVELSLAGRAVAAGDQDRRVGRERAVTPGGDRVAHGVVGGHLHHGLGASDGLQVLRRDRRGRREEVQFPVAPVRRHLPAGRGGILLGADRLQELLVRRDTEREPERAVPVVGEDPVHPRTRRQPGRGADRLVPGAVDLEVRAILALELDLLVVGPARRIDQAVQPQKGLLVEAGGCRGGCFRGLGARAGHEPGECSPATRSRQRVAGGLGARRRPPSPPEPPRRAA